MTVVYTLSPNSRTRRKARRATQREASEVQIRQSVGRVNKACVSVPMRSKSHASSDNICLPQVAIYSAGHRKQVDAISAR
jgi:hypothetical protein